tara:strand:- start:1162 stop:1917 length:756 start_codon:yes stop_codon:yes gene_type:complete
MDEQAVLIPNALPPSPYETALLPWEDVNDFQKLRDAYFVAYPSPGPVETHLIEQLVWCDWRRRRLVLGERALHMASLQSRTSGERYDTLSRRALAVSGGVKPELSSKGAIQSDDAEDAESEANWTTMVKSAETAESLLEVNSEDSYAQALACLPEETAEWFLETCETEEKYEQNTESLHRFVIVEVLPFFRKHLAGARGGPAVRLQAWGESLDPDRMDRLMQLDERLTRQYEKVLGMLSKLQAIRLDAPAK